MQPDLYSHAPMAHTLHQFRNLSPLTHCMTSEVVQSFTVNTLLALGASPAVVIESEEVSQFVAIASALLANVGIPTQGWATVMRAAAEQAHHVKTPWTFDPIAVGTLELRRRFYLELLSLQPTAIRGNASGIPALAGMNGGERGVDTTNTAAAALPAAQVLVRRIGTTVVVTGEVDYITDDQHAVRVDGGDPLMTRVMGTRRALSAVVVASCALRGDRLDNVTSACSWMKQTGQIVIG